METPTIKQILLITDGCSNKGENPIAAAKEARRLGITVNVIGVLEHDRIDERGLTEITGISQAGGGMHQVVYTTNLSQTVQMVTRQAMTQTIQGVVNKQLQQIFGKGAAIEDLTPDRRGEVFEVVETLGETASMEILVLIDTSASMKYKLPTVKEAVFDLSISLNSRKGQNRYAVQFFPGKTGCAEIALDWTDKLDGLTNLFSKLEIGGYTPTGDALRSAILQFQSKSFDSKIDMWQNADYEESL